MSRARNALYGVAATILLVGTSLPASAATIYKTEDLQVDVGGRLQPFAQGEMLQDNGVYNDAAKTSPLRSPGRIYMFQKQSRVKFDIKSKDGFRVFGQAGLGAEDVNTTNVGLSLLDMYADIPLGFGVFKVGQMKVPYGREQLTDSGNMYFADRSINNLGFQTGRDVGLAFQTHYGSPVTLIAGVFTGAGRDVPQRYLPQLLGIPALVGRVGFGDSDLDPFYLKQKDLGLSTTKSGVFLNGMYTRDSVVGHSTALNVKMADKSLLINSNWNPYIGGRPALQGDYWQVGGDAAYRTALSNSMDLTAEAEANYGSFSNSKGSLKLTGGRAQVGVGFKPVDIALRYAVLFPDNNMAVASGSTNISLFNGNTNPIHEITPSLTYRINDNLKFTADLPILVDVPVVVEGGLGAYVLTQQADQSAYLASTKGSSVGRQFVVQCKGTITYEF
jgi:hypothetical protein